MPAAASTSMNSVPPFTARGYQKWSESPIQAIAPGVSTTRPRAFFCKLLRPLIIGQSALRPHGVSGAEG